MPQITCLCGKNISLVEIPSEHQYFFASATKFAELWRRLDDTVIAAGGDVSKREEVEMALASLVAGNLTDFVKCPACARLHVIWDDDEPGVWYAPETPYRRQP